jgi:2-keto-4-pentenoate hydratase/2-oxohepta-3-ene-1,7-dioic acid hydratase in catechol pathway
MRIVSYRLSEESVRPGIETRVGIADLQAVAEISGYSGVEQAGLLDARRGAGLGIAELNSLAEMAATSELRLRATGDFHEVADVHLGPPIPDPQKIICIGLNYYDHAAEAGLTAPAAPIFFAKYPNSLIGPTDQIVPPLTTQAVDYEAELAIVIGETTRRVEATQALDHVIGVMAFNDVSARDLQLANPLWTGGKAVDTFGPCGPALVTIDEFTDIGNLAITTRVNGQVVQNGSTADMIFDVPTLIEFLSQTITLVPGDIIATGTPAGVGNARIPKVFLNEGDICEVEIEDIGLLRNTVVAKA